MHDDAVKRLRRELRLTQLMLLTFVLTTSAVTAGSGCGAATPATPTVLEVEERIAVGPNQELSLEADEDSFELLHRSLQAFSLRCEATSCTLRLPAGESTETYAVLSSDATGTQLSLVGPSGEDDARGARVSLDATDAARASWVDAAFSARLDGAEGLKLRARSGWYAQLGTEDPPFLRLYGSRGNLDLRADDDVPGTSPALEP